MVVKTDTERVKKVRAQVMEYLLVNHPLDCPICDQAGECDLQDFCEAHSFPKSRYEEPKRTYPNEERRPLGPHVFQNQNRCIHCSRCIRFCDEVAGTGELTFAKRGYKMLIDAFPGRELDNPWSACAADLCPVGALTVRDFRFKERVWNLEGADAVCPHCGNGCSIRLEHRSGVVKRFLPRPNPEVNDFWLCDYGRFAFEWMNEATIFEPTLRGEEIAWNEALKALAAHAETLSVLAGPFNTLEELHALKSLFPRTFILPARQDAVKIKSKAGWITAKALAPNAAGAKKLGIPEYKGEKLESVLLFHHPQVPLPAIEFKKLFLDTRFETPLNARAEGILPGALFPEKEGTYLSEHGWVQRARAAFKPFGLARPALDYLTEYAALAGRPAGPSSAEEAFAALPLANGRGYGDLPFKVEL
jgi:NADH-quinone oxidoreductase subunit G